MSLGVTKNTALKRLGCNNNQLTAEGLNALFSTLNDITGTKTIYISSNPGFDDCDQNIATAKGWAMDDVN